MDIQKNAWYPIFAKLQINFIFIRYPTKCLKFNQFNASFAEETEPADQNAHGVITQLFKTPKENEKREE